MDVKATFELWAGDDVRYVGHERTGRSIEITYRIPKVDGERKFHVDVLITSGVPSAVHAAIKRCAGAAQTDAYRRTGQRDADMANLMQGKLA